MSNNARQDEELSTQRRSRILGLDYIDTSQNVPKQLFRDLLSTADIKANRIVPITADKFHILFGITNTTPKSIINIVVTKFNDHRVSFGLISDSGFNEYVNLYDPPKKVVYTDIALKDTGSAQLIQEISSILTEVKADDMLAYLVSQAHRLNSSDIHIETQEGDVRIRLRIDGVLHPIARIPFEKYRVLISAIASAGNVSTGVNEAQQGHIAQKVRMADGQIVDVNVRLETVPTINGMDVVMRLFNLDETKYNLNKLGLSEAERRTVDNVISRPNGLVMVVGPTGSGKTTTLYSILNSLNNDERKIITIEDPVEYQFHGISQIPVRSSESGNDSAFANKLRAVLRLDPDIVMIGEIRDTDTARTALQASLTGHLVLTTFHAGNAAAALTRLADIIGQNPLFVSAINLIMAQRLVRRLDDRSKIAYDPSPEELMTIQKVLDSFPQSLTKPSLEGLKLYKAGLSPDNPYGFSGQIALREQMTMTESVRKVVLNPTTIVSSTDIEQAAINDGMTTILQDAILKVLDGHTTMEELFRVLS